MIQSTSMEKVKRSSRRSYGQFCALARALDVVGDRWSPLIVRDLLAGPMRYSDLKSSLPGIATNLLTERLRALEVEGVVRRELGASGIVYALTPWGSQLRTPLEALGAWGLPLLAPGRGDDAFQPRWLAIALPAMLGPARADPAVEVGLEMDGLLIVVRIDADGPHAAAAGAPRPATVLAAEPDVIVGLAAGMLTVEHAVASGTLHGDAGALHRVFDRARDQSASG